eukprot:12543175-Prorocentrum_lima.AAC.1
MISATVCTLWHLAFREFRGYPYKLWRLTDQPTYAVRPNKSLHLHAHSRICRLGGPPGKAGVTS